MTLIREFRDESRVHKGARKRAIIACERCYDEKDVTYGYYQDCQKKDRKYCKPCKMIITSEASMELNNQNQPKSKCLSIFYDEEGKCKGNFECTKCGSQRVKRHETKSYEQYCFKCQKTIDGHAREKHSVRHDTRLGRIYRNIKARCYDSNSSSYHNYGAKGVTVCREWLDDRTKFYDWALANGYRDDLECDKDKKSKELGISPAIYSPDTCTWMTHSENGSWQGNRSGTIAKGIAKYSETKFRLRKTNRYPFAKEGYYHTLDDAIEARGALA